MTLTHKIYKELSDALKSGKHHTLSKIYTAPNGLSLIYAMEENSEKRSLFFSIDEKASDTMPQCRGLSIGKVHLYEYSPVDFYCQISQNSGDENYIYEVIIEDIRKNVDELKNDQNMASRIAKLLLKWRSFFAQEKEMVLSLERQQGLYGELLFLMQLIEIQGPSAVSLWTGCDYETHDFYVKGNAVEIKTTSTKAPYKMHISSEYQLDDNEVTGELLINFFALRKSSADGETLPELISRIRNLISNNVSMSRRFEACLEAYGYFDGLEEKYTTGYYIREEHTYCVRDGFPRITKSMLIDGITGCTYDLLVNNCTSFEIVQEEKIRKLKGCETSGR